jgi:hypothetical protein
VLGLARLHYASGLQAFYVSFYQHFLANVEKGDEQAQKNRLCSAYQPVFSP